MICPHCGNNQPENAAACANCGYKFRFGHAFNDPGKMMFVQGKGSPAILLFIIGCISILVFAIWVWIRAN